MWKWHVNELPFSLIGWTYLLQLRWECLIDFSFLFPTPSLSVVRISLPLRSIPACCPPGKRRRNRRTPVPPYLSLCLLHTSQSHSWVLERVSAFWPTSEMREGGMDEGGIVRKKRTMVQMNEWMNRWIDGGMLKAVVRVCLLSSFFECATCRINVWVVGLQVDKWWRVFSLREGRIYAGSRLRWKVWKLIRGLRREGGGGGCGYVFDLVILGFWERKTWLLVMLLMVLWGLWGKRCGRCRFGGVGRDFIRMGKIWRSSREGHDDESIQFHDVGSWNDMVISPKERSRSFEFSRVGWKCKKVQLGRCMVIIVTCLVFDSMCVILGWVFAFAMSNEREVYSAVWVTKSGGGLY